MKLPGSASAVADGIRTGLRWVAPAGLLVAFLLFTHHLLAEAGNRDLALLLALAWLALLAVMASLSSTRPRLGLGLTAAACATLLLNLAWLRQHVEQVYVGQHVASMVLLALWFGSTLRGDGRREALVTVLATRVHGPLPEPIRRYTRQVTAAWAGFFAIDAAVSLLLFLTASIETWSVFANLMTAPLIGAMFVAEYLVRIRRFPDFQHVSFMAGVQAWRQRDAQNPAQRDAVQDGLQDNAQGGDKAGRVAAQGGGLPGDAQADKTRADQDAGSARNIAAHRTDAH